jgi:hypothetical protein
VRRLPHPRNAKGKLDTTRHLQGGPLTIKPAKETGHWADKAPNITRGGLAGKWTEAQLVKLLMTGENPEGENPHPPMPAYRMQEKDARAIAQYLKSLPGKKEGREEKGD